MSKREAKHIVWPIGLWQTETLSWMAKIILMEIDSYPRTEQGVNVRSGAVATALGITKKECDAALKELFDKGAFKVNVDEGQQLLIPLIYKDEYIADGTQKNVIGEKPDTTNMIDFDEVAEQWSKICSMLPPIQRWTPQRKRKVRACLKQADLTVADLYKVFRIVASVAFLNGSSDQFKADFDWLVKKSENVDKVYRGFYSRSASEKIEYDNIMGIKEVANTSNDHQNNYWQ